MFRGWMFRAVLKELIEYTVDSIQNKDMFKDNVREMFYLFRIYFFFSDEIETIRYFLNKINRHGVFLVRASWILFSWSRIAIHNVQTFPDTLGRFCLSPDFVWWLRLLWRCVYFGRILEGSIICQNIILDDGEINKTMKVLFLYKKTSFWWFGPGFGNKHFLLMDRFFIYSNDKHRYNQIWIIENFFIFDQDWNEQKYDLLMKTKHVHKTRKMQRLIKKTIL